MEASAALFVTTRPLPRLAQLSPVACPVGGALFAGIMATVAILAATESQLEIAEFGRFFLLGLGLFGLALWCERRLPDRRLAHAAAIVGVATWALILCGIVSNVGLRLGVPLADGLLAQADALVGIDAGAVVRSVAARPLLTEVLAIAYNWSGIAVVATIILCIALNRTGRAWELATTAIVAMQVVAIASLASPAWGVMRYFGLEHLQGRGLPDGAGVYQWQAFAHFRGGSDGLVRLGDMGGVVAFPSFHTVLALMLSQALAGTRLQWLGPPWSALIILAAIPMGGHYAVDLAAGFLVWLGSAVLARRVSSPSA